MSLTSHIQGGKQLLPSLPAVERLSPLVWRLLGMNPGSFTLTGTNTYLIGRGPRRILLDTGEGKPAYLDTLERGMKEAGCEAISEIIISHWHYDHLGGLPSVIAKLGAVPVRKFMPQHDEPTFRGEGSRDPYSIWPRERFVPLEDNGVVRADGATMHVLHTPGHANDHVALFLEEEGAMFTGDNVLGIGTTVFRDLHEYLLSLRRMAGRRPGRLYPAHGPVVEHGMEKIAEYIAHRQSRMEQVVTLLSVATADGVAACTLEALTRKMYAEIPEELVRPAMANTAQVLVALEKDGIVEMDGKDSAEAAPMHAAGSWRLRVPLADAIAAVRNKLVAKV